MRYENKFVFDKVEYSSIVNQVMSASTLFREIYYKRKINNIYLDTIEFSNYYANIMGEQNRIKQRIRWYGDTLGADQPVLEYKIKHGELGDKEYYDMPEFVLNETFRYDQYVKDVEKHASSKNEPKYVNMYNEIVHLVPTLYNTYEREYYMSADGKYRITIDNNMIFNSIGNTFTGSYNFHIHDILVELKYENEDRVGASEIMQEFQFRMSRNSKYVNGISGLYFNEDIFI